jgi:hypothetical protein
MNFYLKPYLNISTFTVLNLLYVVKVLNLKYLFALICAFCVYVAGYEVYHCPPFLAYFQERKVVLPNHQSLYLCVPH